MRRLMAYVGCVVIGVSVGALRLGAAEPVPDVTAPPAALKVPAFYTKFISAHGYPIVASARVNDYALREAAYLVNLMLAQRPDVRQALVANGSRTCILGYNEFTTDLPEFARWQPQDYWDARARGTGGSQTDPYCSCGEENLLAYPGDPYAAECILIHEFAHHLHLRGLVKVDATFDRRLKAAYDQAMTQGLWKGKYAAVNHHEYFAEGVQSWFDNNRPPDHDHNHVDTRAELLDYDPGLAAMCREVFGDTVLEYTKPTTRLSGHLAGYDPTQAPTFAWPERLQKAKAEIAAQARRRDREANGGERETRRIAGWTVHVSRRLWAEQPADAERALQLLESQLDDVTRHVPSVAVAELQKVALWFSPEYPGARPTAEYHPDVHWLRDHHRDPAMAQGIEFTNVRIFEAETKRMPNFVLHELAHAYHDRVLGFDHGEIRAAYEAAKASGRYDHVKRWTGERETRERAYALTDPKEYFAETSEAYFGRNDFEPFQRGELAQHDPQMLRLLEKLWGVRQDERTSPDETSGQP